MARRITVSVPDLGDFKYVEVIDVLVAPGAEIAVETPLITLETDKAAMDVPSTAAGRVAELHIKKGDRVSKGDPILVLEAEGPAAVSSAGPVAVAQPVAAPVAVNPAAATAMVEVRVPDLGDFRDVEVIDVLAATGDNVALESPLITLETDKATMDVPSSAAGRIVAMHVAKGARVSAGDLVAIVQGTAAAAPAPAPADTPVMSPAPTPAAVAVGDARTPVPTPAVQAGSSRAHAGPAVRQLARELGVDLAKVKGSGVKGRITQDDVKAFVKRVITAAPAAPAASPLPRVPDVDFAAFGPVEVRPLGRIQKISSTRLQASWVNIPHVTQHEEADVTELEALRASLKERAASLGIKLTPLAFVARACASVIAQFPNFN
ncbi:MAG: biotin/lipoyl-containing protein, partial [Steroidobacteraceae bacterium]